MSLDFVFDGGDTPGDENGGSEVGRCFGLDSLLINSASVGGIRRRTLTSKPGAQKSGVNVIIVKSNGPYTREAEFFQS